MLNTQDLVAEGLTRPLPGEHACRLREVSAFEADSFRRSTRRSNGKEYGIIMGRLKGRSEMTEQSYRYPKSSWTEAQARKHCSGHGGRKFEPASGEKARDDEIRISLPAFHRQANFQPSTIDEENRSVELVWTAGAVVRRRGFFETDWDEALSLDDGAVDLTRLNSNASLLDSHQAREISRVIGVVERAWLQGSGRTREGRAVVRFSQRPDVEPVWQDVRDGILRNVSVGYSTIEAVRKERKNDVPLVTLTRWQPYELSLVAVPADAQAQIRSDQELYPCVVRGDTAMATRTTSAAAATDEAARAAAAEDLENEDQEDVNERDDDRQDEPEEQPAARGKGKAQQRNGARGKVRKIEDEAERETERQRSAESQGNGRANGKSEAEIEAEIERRANERIEADRKRRDRIEKACRSLRLDPKIGQRLINEGVSADDAWEAMLNEADKRERLTAIVERPTNVQPGEHDEETKLRKALTSALLHRYDPLTHKLEFGAEEFRSFSILEMGRYVLQRSGARIHGLSKFDLVGQMTNMRAAGYHTTTDFANILADVANKTLRAAYDEAPRTFAPFCRRVTMADFKNRNVTQFGEAPVLTEIDEHGEFTSGTIGDAKETYALRTFGKKFGITRKSIINDDLDAFTRAPQLFGNSAARTENNIVWAVITANAAMGDGNNLFSTAHGNLKSGSSGAPNVATVGAARAAMRIQKGLDGTTLINVAPAFLIVPAALETVAEQFLSGTLVPSQTSNVVPERMRRSLELIVEPRLDADSTTAWYLAARPSEIDTIEYAYLDGEETVMIETRTGWDVDGVEIRARLDFASKAIEWRGLYKDAGT